MLFSTILHHITNENQFSCPFLPKQKKGLKTAFSTFTRRFLRNGQFFRCVLLFFCASNAVANRIFAQNFSNAVRKLMDVLCQIPINLFTGKNHYNLTSANFTSPFPAINSAKNENKCGLNNQHGQKTIPTK